MSDTCKQCGADMSIIGTLGTVGMDITAHTTGSMECVSNQLAQAIEWRDGAFKAQRTMYCENFQAKVENTELRKLNAELRTNLHEWRIKHGR